MVSFLRGITRYTRRRTLANFVVQARPRAAVEYGISAGANGKGTVQQAQRLAHRLAGGVGTKVERLVFPWPAHHRQARVGLLRVKPQVDVVFIVTQVD